MAIKHEQVVDLSDGATVDPNDMAQEQQLHILIDLRESIDRLGDVVEVVSKAALRILEPQSIAVDTSPEITPPSILTDWETQERWMRGGAETLKVPSHLHASMVNYVLDGDVSGQERGFVAALFMNDLRLFSSVVVSSTIDTIDDLRATMTWIHVHAPAQCRGSREAVDSWIKLGGMKGIAK